MTRKESPEALKKRAASVLKKLARTYPEAATELHHGSPLELLVATILSAQCTDERVNIVSEELFRTYRTAEDFAGAEARELERIIHSTGFFRSKAKNIINCCKLLADKYKGEVPARMEDLVSLPGVGRKTANVILGNFFGIPAGVVVDTHVKRLAGRLGFSSNTDPEKIEDDLMKIFPSKDWISLGNVLVWHGRRICQARKPACPECPVKELCPSAGKV